MLTDKSKFIQMLEVNKFGFWSQNENIKQTS